MRAGRCRAWRGRGEGMRPLHLDERERSGHYGRVEATGLLSFPVWAPFLHGLEPYDHLLKAVQEKVADPAAVLAFAYDWRLPVAVNGALLAEAAHRHLAAWRDSDAHRRARQSHPDQREGRLVFVAHSMGGLVTGRVRPRGGAGQRSERRHPGRRHTGDAVPRLGQVRRHPGRQPLRPSPGPAEAPDAGPGRNPAGCARPAAGLSGAWVPDGTCCGSPPPTSPYWAVTRNWPRRPRTSSSACVRPAHPACPDTGPSSASPSPPPRACAWSTESSTSSTRRSNATGTASRRAPRTPVCPPGVTGPGTAPSTVTPPRPPGQLLFLSASWAGPGPPCGAVPDGGGRGRAGWVG
jgi:hypothetical protein